MAGLQDTIISGSLTTNSLKVTGQSIILPQLGTINSGSRGQIFIGNDLKLKLTQVGSYGTGTWSTATGLINATNGGMGIGTGKAAMVISGENFTAPVYLSTAECYDGSSWSSGTAAPYVAVTAGAAGTTNAGAIFGGYTPGAWTSCTSEFNGSSWSAGGNMITTRNAMGASGTQNTILAHHGNPPGGASRLTCTEEYNGTSWSSGGSALQQKRQSSSAGSQNAAIEAGGCNHPGPNYDTSSEYNGVSWAYSSCLPSGRGILPTGATGQCQTDAIIYHGSNPTGTTDTYSYNGTTWNIENSANFARSGVAGAGATNNALSAGGGSYPSAYNCVEEFTKPLVEPFSFCIGSWSVGGALITARCFAGNAGTPTAGLAAAGNGGLTCTEEYDGSSWATGGALICARVAEYNQMTGLQDAALAAGGYAGSPHLNVSEEYNGTAWASGGTLATARSSGGAFGTQNAGALTGGYGPSSPANTRLTCTEEYNGTSWSSGGALIAARFQNQAVGTQNAGLTFGGVNNVSCTATEEYNGTSWSNGGSLINASGNGAGIGTQDSAFSVCCSSFEEYDGSTWSTKTPSLTTSREAIAGAGTTTAGFVAGGRTPTILACTEEWGYQSYCTATYQCYLPAVWSAATALPSAIANGAGLGIVNAAAFVSGIATPPGTYTSEVKEYNGTSWSAGGAITTSIQSAGSSGTQNAGVVFGGQSPGITYSNCTQHYNGSTWSAGGNLITSMLQIGPGGKTDDAALAFGGWTPAAVSCTEEYNGTAWSTGGALNVAGRAIGGAGTQNAALAAGGVYRYQCAEEYNGTSWSVAGAKINAFGNTATGCVIGALAVAGYPTCSQVEEYDGTSWSATTAVSTGRYSHCMSTASPSTSALMMGGRTPTNVTCVEEYSKEYVYYNLHCFVRDLCTQ